MSFEDIFYGELHQCGCGDPEKRWHMILQILNRNSREIGDVWLADVVEIIKETDPWILAEFIVSALDPLLEHGTSCRFNWLTELGEKAKGLPFEEGEG